MIVANSDTWFEVAISNSAERLSPPRDKMVALLLLQTISFEDSIGAAKQHLQPFLFFRNP